MTDQSNSGGSSGSSPSTTSAPSSIDDLLNSTPQLTQYDDGKDFQISLAALNAVTIPIEEFKSALIDVGTQAAPLTDYGSPGGFQSANAVVKQLQRLVTVQFIPNLNEFIKYLDDLEKAVNAAAIRLFEGDQPVPPAQIQPIPHSPLEAV